MHQQEYDDLTFRHLLSESSMRKTITTLLGILLCFYGIAQKMDTLINVGTHRLHFTIIPGKGTPILFESGNGDDGTVWEPILKSIHDSTGATLITYDRAGLGLSEIDTTKATLLNEIKDLKTGLQKLGYSKKIVLVCHSFGGYYSSLYAEQNPKKVKGIVFIDVLTPCFFTKQRAKETKESISPEDWSMIKKEAPGLYYVLNDLENIYELTKDKKLPAKIPATVICADQPPRIVKEAEQDEWKSCLKYLGTQPNHHYIFAKNCGHKVWNDNPTLVVNEIVNLYRKVR